MPNLCRPHTRYSNFLQPLLKPINFFCKANYVPPSEKLHNPPDPSTYWQHYQRQEVYEFCQESRWSFAFFDHCWLLPHRSKRSFHYIPWYLWVCTNWCVLDFPTFYWIQKVPTWYESSMYVLMTCFHESWILYLLLVFWERKNCLFNKNT